MHARLIYHLTDPTCLLASMEMSRAGVAWNTLFDGRYTRR